jgi:hypothetical protein
MNKAFLVENGHRACRIDEDQIASTELDETIIMIEGRFSRHLEEDSKVLKAIEARMSRGTVDHSRVTREVYRAQPIHVVGLEPANEVFRVKTRGINRTGPVQ